MKKIIPLACLILTACGSDNSGSSVVQSGVICSALKDGILFEYKIEELTSGDAYIVCDVGDKTCSSQNAWILRPSAEGFAERKCVVRWDIDTPSIGFWTFKQENGVRSVTYTDTTSASSGTKVEFTEADCVKF